MAERDERHEVREVPRLGRADLLLQERGDERTRVLDRERGALRVAQVVEVLEAEEVRGLAHEPLEGSAVGGAHLLLLPAALTPEHRVPRDPRGLAGPVVVGGLLGLLLEVRQHQVREVRPEPEGDLIGIVDLRRGQVRALRRVFQQPVHRALAAAEDPRELRGDVRLVPPVREPSRDLRDRGVHQLGGHGSPGHHQVLDAVGKDEAHHAVLARLALLEQGREAGLHLHGQQLVRGDGYRRGLHAGERARGVADDGAVFRGERLEVVGWGHGCHVNCRPRGRPMQGK
jgi:hypothetical protein